MPLIQRLGLEVSSLILMLETKEVWLLWVLWVSVLQWLLPCWVNNSSMLVVILRSFWTRITTSRTMKWRFHQSISPECRPLTKARGQVLPIMRWKSIRIMPRWTKTPQLDLSTSQTISPTRATSRKLLEEKLSEVITVRTLLKIRILLTN